MRVLLWMNSSGDGIQGGHQTQIRQTASHLEELGVTTRFSFDAQADLSDLDLVHSFGLEPAQIRTCWQRGLRVATSTIYWTRDYALGIDDGTQGLAKWKRRLKMAAILARSALAGKHPQKCEALTQRQWKLRTVYEMSDMLLPNSHLEGEAVVRELGVTTPIIVAVNAVSPEQFNLPPEGSPRNGVMCVARFEPHKNQLGLIKALRGTGLPLTLAGFAHPHHEKYLEACRREGARSGNVQIVAGMSMAELIAAYQRTKVHVLPSWFETTGLVSLEAALCGANIVTANRGYAKEFFLDMAWYCDPAKPRTIREAVLAAHAAPTPTGLRPRILTNYTWRHTAAATLRGYQQVLAMPSVRRDAAQIEEMERLGAGQS